MSRLLTALIVDDEPIAANRLRLLCEELGSVRVVGLASDGHEALERIEVLAPDLLLLDIAMPGLGGLAVAERLGRMAAPPAIVFCTAYDRHALEAFNLSALDYLLKPISRERLARAIDRVRRDRDPREAGAAAAPWIDHLWVPHRGAMQRIEITAITRIDAEGDYLRLSTPTVTYLLHETMGAIERRLDPTLFLRLRRSVIVKSDRVTGLQHEGAGIWSATLADSERIRIGPTHLKRVKDRLLA